MNFLQRFGSFDRTGVLYAKNVLRRRGKAELSRHGLDARPEGDWTRGKGSIRRLVDAQSSEPESRGHGSGHAGTVSKIYVWSNAFFLSVWRVESPTNGWWWVFWIFGMISWWRSSHTGSSALRVHSDVCIIRFSTDSAHSATFRTRKRFAKNWNPKQTTIFWWNLFLKVWTFRLLGRALSGGSPISTWYMLKALLIAEDSIVGEDQHHSAAATKEKPSKKQSNLLHNNDNFHCQFEVIQRLRKDFAHCNLRLNES